MAYKLEAKGYNRASLITGQTMGIVDNIKDRFPNTNLHWLPNGVDLEFYKPENINSAGFREKNSLEEDDVIFFYGGILGHAQGLHVVLEAAKLCESNSNIKIILQGAGPEKEELLALNDKLNLKNVLFLPPVQKNEMPGILKEVDVALVPLRKLDIFQGAIPSKIFEALAMETPLLLGVDGEARKHFIDKAEAGVYFEPENIKELANCMKEMVSNPERIKTMGVNARKYVSKHFDRNNIANDFLDVLNNN